MVATKSPSKSKVEFPVCACGCKGKTRGGRFIPGHDSKLKGVLKRAMADGGLNAAQKAQMKELGWEHLVTGDSESRVYSVPQVNILRTLKKSPGLTRAQIEAAVGCSINMVAELGPAFREDVAESEKKFGRKSLIGARLVTAEKTDSGIIYNLTKNGVKALAEIK